MFGGSSPCSLKAARSSFRKADPLLNWDDARRDGPSNGHFKGPDAARGKCLSFDEPFNADILSAICAKRRGDKLMRGQKCEVVVDAGMKTTGKSVESLVASRERRTTNIK